MTRPSALTIVGLAAAAAGAALGVAGCSGEASSCSTFAGCGGDVVGKWTIATACYGSEVSGGNESCPQATYDTSHVSVSGSFTFGADKMYMRSTIFSGSVSMTMPASCLSMGGMTLTCDQFGTLLSGLITQDMDSTVEKVSCSGSSTCSCTITYKATSQDESGTYTTSGSSITLTPSGGKGGGDMTDYCVKGDELDYAAESSTDMGPMGTMQMRSYFIARK